MLKFNSLKTELEKSAYVYILAYFLGRGWIIQKKSCFTLDLHCNLAFPKIIENISSNLKTIFPSLNVRTNIKKEYISSTCVTNPIVSSLFPANKLLDKNCLDLIYKYPAEFLKGIFESQAKMIILNGEKLYQYSAKDSGILNTIIKCLELQNYKYETFDKYTKRNIYKLISIKNIESVNKLDKLLDFNETLRVARKHTEQTKERLSQIRKDWLSKHPEHKPWTTRVSPPCELFKEFLRAHNIYFIPEFPAGVDGRFFSIDIAIPAKKIAIEINGNQHYLSYGKELTPYFQERHDLLVGEGWNVYEIPSRICYEEDKRDYLLNSIKNSESILDFDYLSYKPKENSIYDLCHCGNRKLIPSLNCITCRVKPEKIVWPSDRELFDLVWENPMTKVAAALNVSSNAIKKRCIKLEIPFPGSSYWRNFILNNKERCLKIKEEKCKDYLKQ